ncbi:MAG: MFS transporter [Haloferacaceae archaeon]
MTERVTRRYYLHRAAMHTGFFWPVFPLFLRSRGVSFAGIGTLLAVEAAAKLVSEVPTGFVGDAVGRRNSLLLASGLVLVAELGFVIAHHITGFVLVYLCFGLARTFQSGSGDAWLYDALENGDRASEFTRVRGRGESVTHWASALAMLASGVLYAADPVAPFLAAAALTLVDAGVLLTLPRADAAGETRVGVREVLPLVRRTLSQSPVRSFVAAAAAFFGVERAVSEFVPSVTASVLDGALPFVLPSSGGSVDVVFVGVFFAAFTVTSAAASYVAGDVRARYGAPAALVGVGYLSAVLLAASLLLPTVALLGFLTVKTADALVVPLVNGYVNDHVDTAGRATTLSATSMLFTLAKMPLLVAAGALADATRALDAVSGLGVFLAVATAVVLRWEVPTETGEAGETASQG